MDAQGFLGGIAQNLLANLIGWGVSVMIGAAFVYWTKVKELWSWPAAIAIGLFVVASVLVIWSNPLGWKLTAKPDNWESFRKETVLAKTFRNETVVLDGKSFAGCAFENVTFQYDAAGPFDLVNNKIQGSYVLSSKNPRVLALLTFLKEFRYLNPEVKVYQGK
jgi:hypothetical protein